MISKLTIAILGLAYILTAIVFGPWYFIWGVNEIFGLDIEWRWQLWFAVHGLFFMIPRNTGSGD